MTILKSIGAVVAGFVTVVVLSVVTDLVLEKAGVLPMEGPLNDIPLLLLATFYRTVYTILGGYVAARLAPSRPLVHAIILGVIGTVAGSIGAITNADLGPAWYAWGLVVLAIPSVWFGAKMYKGPAKIEVPNLV